MARHGRRKKLTREEQLTQFYAQRRGEQGREQETSAASVTTPCPVCNREIVGPPDVLNAHINWCLDSSSHQASNSSRGHVQRRERSPSPPPMAGTRDIELGLLRDGGTTGPDNIEDDELPMTAASRTRRTRREETGAITATSAPASDLSPSKKVAVKGAKRKKQPQGDDGADSSAADSALSRRASISGSESSHHVPAKKKIHVRVRVPVKNQQQIREKAIALAKSRGIALVRKKQERNHGGDAPSGAETTDEMDYWEQAKEMGCTICMEKVKRAIMLPCRHIFCRKCIGRWLDRHNTCPMCRRQLWIEPESNAHSEYQRVAPRDGFLGLIDSLFGDSAQGDSQQSWSACNYFACIVVCCLAQQVLCMFIVYFVSIGGSGF